jgi:hypothetical protein
MLRDFDAAVLSSASDAEDMVRGVCKKRKKAGCPGLRGLTIQLLPSLFTFQVKDAFSDK